MRDGCLCFGVKRDDLDEIEWRSATKLDVRGLALDPRSLFLAIAISFSRMATVARPGAVSHGRRLLTLVWRRDWRAGPHIFPAGLLVLLGHIGETSSARERQRKDIREFDQTARCTRHQNDAKANRPQPGRWRASKALSLSEPSRALPAQPQAHRARCLRFLQSGRSSRIRKRFIAISGRTEHRVGY